MGIYICPNCRVRILYSSNNCEFNHTCNPEGHEDAIQKESLPVIGPWNDFTGSQNVNSRTQQLFGGVTNQLRGTVADIEGHAKLPNLNAVGENADTHRRRQRVLNFDLSHGN